MSPITTSAGLGIPNPRDVFISPHSDDVCFSLAGLAHLRQAGRLLNVFSISPYTAERHQQHSDNTRGVTRRRCAEDGLFAQACGLTLESLEFKDAMARHEHPFDARHSEGISRQIEAKLLASLVGPMLGLAPINKPWMFVPSGIGGHVDHLAVLIVILRHMSVLAKVYRIAFYEDLFYASHAMSRQHAISALKASLKARQLNRLHLSLDLKMQALKLELVQIYASQLTDNLKTIKAFTPAENEQAVPHEALWVLQDA